jgi:hypothetical protein
VREGGRVRVECAREKCGRERVREWRVRVYVLLSAIGFIWVFVGLVH